MSVFVSCILFQCVFFLGCINTHTFQSSTESQQATGDETSLVARNNHLEVTMHTGNQEVS